MFLKFLITFSAFFIVVSKPIETIKFFENPAFSPIDRFISWIEEFKIKFEDSIHHSRVLQNWINNDLFILENNSLNNTFILGHNAYSGYSSEEFAELMGFAQNRKSYSQNQTSFSLRGNMHFKRFEEVEIELDVDTLPISVDWRLKNAVTPVKDQGQCGSCWSFSTTGSLEGAYAIKNDNLVSLSEQQLVDCDNFIHGGSDSGCNGGLMENALNWVTKYGGLCTEQVYPYVSGTTTTAGKCQQTCSKVDGTTVKSVVSVTSNSDNAMMTALTINPVSVAIEADQSAFQLYKSGVFTGSCGDNLDHGVLLVGYGSTSSSDYYILKNSWGSSWGEQGYILLGKGNNPVTGKPYNGGAGQCGVLSDGVYPTL